MVMKNYSFTTGITKQEDSFNAYLNQGRVVVEHAFGRLKGRWRRLTKKIDANFKYAPTIISACCVLHNIVEVNKENFSEDWINTVKLNAQTYPQPNSVQAECSYRASTREREEGEKVRNALLEITNQLPTITSLNWRVHRY